MILSFFVFIAHCFLLTAYCLLLKLLIIKRPLRACNWLAV